MTSNLQTLTNCYPLLEEIGMGHYLFLHKVLSGVQNLQHSVKCARIQYVAQLFSPDA